MMGIVGGEHPTSTEGYAATYMGGIDVESPAPGPANACPIVDTELKMAMETCAEVLGESGRRKWGQAQPSHV